MSQFRLLAIRPLIDCSSKFRKNLKEGVIYKFYSDYQFSDKSNQGVEISFENKNISNPVREITSPKPTKVDLYSFNPELTINISAVIGQNGSGKSTLIELLYYAMYVLGCNVKVDPNDKGYLLKTSTEKLKGDITWSEKRLIRKNYDGMRHLQREHLDELIDLRERLKLEKKRQVEIEKGLAVSIFFEKKVQEGEESVREFYELRVNQTKLLEKSEKLERIQLIDIATQNSTSLDKVLLEKLFYSISINHSHYSLNSKETGRWINTLFHKNDAYKTPIVINPMRDDGNFDVNHENYHAKQRLLSNAILQYLNLSDEETKVYLSDNQWIIFIRFTIYNSESLFSEKETLELPYSKEILINTFGTDYQKSISTFNNTNFFWSGLDYCARKVEKIQRKYPEYGLEIDKIGINDKRSREQRKVDSLIEDNSHIVFKLKQAVHFIERNVRLNKLKESKKSQVPDIFSIAPDKKDVTVFDFEFPELIEWMGVSENDTLQTIYSKIPPRLFDIDFLLSSDDQKNDDPPSFETMSSGEKQLIHSLQSVYYHLGNLESIYGSEENTDRIKYENVNIIYDEIELYFHPDLQRKFISRMLDGIKRLKLTEIKSINVLFATHSPFILSDIPAKNILHLENGLPSNKSLGETFGANIHDLLATNFFLEDGFMGEFAKGKIEETIRFLNKKKWYSEKLLLEGKVISDDGNLSIQEKKINIELRLSITQLDDDISSLAKKGTIRDDPNYYKGIIELIGEPILRNKLNETYRELFESVEKKEAWKEIMRIAKKSGIVINGNNDQPSTK